MAFLLPIRLSSTMKTIAIFWARSASNSAMTCALVFRRGRRPKVTMMSQNSHWNGQPRENCTLPNRVMLHRQQVEPRHGHPGHVGPLGLLVAALVRPLLPFLQKSRPGLFRLADEDHVGQVAEILLLDADPGAADHREHAAALQFGEDFAHPGPLHVHARHADDVGPRAPIVVDRLDIFVDQRHRVLGRRQRGQKRQAGGGQLARLPKSGKACSRPQYETSNRGLISTISAKRGPLLP